MRRLKPHMRHGVRSRLRRYSCTRTCTLGRDAPQLRAYQPWSPSVRLCAAVV